MFNVEWSMRVTSFALVEWQERLLMVRHVRLASSAGRYWVVMRRLASPRRTLLAARFSRKPASRSRSGS